MVENSVGQTFRNNFFRDANIIELTFSGMQYNSYTQESLASGLEAVGIGKNSQREVTRSIGMWKNILSDHLMGKSVMGSKAVRKLGYLEKWKTS